MKIAQGETQRNLGSASPSRGNRPGGPTRKETFPSLQKTRSGGRRGFQPAQKPVHPFPKVSLRDEVALVCALARCQLLRLSHEPLANTGRLAGTNSLIVFGAGRSGSDSVQIIVVLRRQAFPYFSSSKKTISQKDLNCSISLLVRTRILVPSWSNARRMSSFAAV